MKYLIISTNAIGDTYLSASSIRLITSNDRNADIDFISTAICHPILELLLLKNIYTVSKSIIDIFNVAFQIRRKNYDFVFSFFPGLVNSFFFLVSKGDKKGGYVNFIRLKEWYKIKQRVFIKGAQSKKLVWSPNNNYLDRIKLPLSVFFDMTLPNCFQKKLMEVPVSESKYSNSILIHPFSRSKERALGYDSLKKLIKYFEKQNKVFVIGTEKDFHDLNDSTISQLSNLKFIELVEAILSCKLFIAVDSFPIHIADAHNTNFIGLFGPTNPKAVLVNHIKAIRFKSDRLDGISFETVIEELYKSKIGQLTK